MRDYRGTNVIITGASSGLGAEFAARFAARGAGVVLVARREDRLRDLAQKLESRHGVSAVPLALDLGRPDAAASLRGMLDERGIRVHSLLNNAGFGAKGAFIDSDPERMQQMVALNIATLVSLTREFLPDLVSGNGVLVNLASTAAYQPVPSMAVYAASKAFVLSFTESIAYETRGTGLGVLALSPGPTRTEFFDVVGETVATPGGFETADEVVTRALKELDRAHPRASVVSGRMNAIQARLVGMLPRRLALNVSGRVA
ncbi:MAG TPA: SDR family NAD(P)-dependent oxidoreductase [Pseudonocardia sp.]|nr:SDR family NAD(P)-dependent oxidoreductase [Pseudonocardia sp.]